MITKPKVKLANGYICSMACRFCLPKMQLMLIFSYTILCLLLHADDDKARKFVDYFCEIYIDTNMFLPELWVQSSDTDYSTQNSNATEGFNRHFYGPFNSPHPLLYVFWEAVVKQQSVTYYIIRPLNTIREITSPERNRHSNIIKCWHK
jgi:hypothetical protein